MQTNNFIVKNATTFVGAQRYGDNQKNWEILRFCLHHFKNMNPRLQYLLPLLESNPKDAFVLFAIAKEYENTGDEAQALTYYLRLKETEEGYVGLYYHLGKLYERCSEVENARKAYQQGIEISKKAGDRHALSELQAALLNLDYD